MQYRISKAHGHKPVMAFCCTWCCHEKEQTEMTSQNQNMHLKNIFCSLITPLFHYVRMCRSVFHFFCCCQNVITPCFFQFHTKILRANGKKLFPPSHFPPCNVRVWSCEFKTMRMVLEKPYKALESAWP